MSPARLSVVIITLDEERDLPACLESVRPLGAEIVLVDGGSTDRTLEIAGSHGCKIYVRPFQDFTRQKQGALDLASGDWALSIDADERVSAPLAGEILRLLGEEPAESGFLVPFSVHFMGRRLRFGGLGSERHLRLFRRSAGRFAGGELHEGVRVEGALGRLRHPIEHHPYRNMDEYLHKMIAYTTLAAHKRRAAGTRFTCLHHLLPAWEFFVRCVLRLGMLDGTPGVAWAGLASFHTWIKFLKLREAEGAAGPAGGRGSAAAETGSKA